MRKATLYKDCNIIRVEGCYCIYRNGIFQAETPTFSEAVEWINNN